MKNLVATLLFAFTIAASSTSFAAKSNPDNELTPPVPTPAVTFGQMEKSKLDVAVAYVSTAQMTIRLFDSSGKNIATKTLSQRETGTRVRFDLTTLEDGVYQVKVTDGQHTQVQKFEIKTAPARASYQHLTIG